MNNYIIAKYIRLSIDDAITDSLSISNQRKLLDRHIDELEIPNATVLEFCDNGHSGTHMERPAVLEMLDLVRSGGVNCICVKDFSRFSRNAMDSGYFVEQVFPLYGVRFISLADNFDSDDYKGDTGGIDVAFKFLMHEYYSQDLSKKVKSAKRLKMKNGEYFSKRTIYGYERTDDKQLVPNDPAASVVRRIYALALDGQPTAKIRDILASEQIPTPSQYIAELLNIKTWQSDCWTARMVLQILTNEQYTGTYISGKQESKSVGSHNKNYTPKDEWIIIPDKHTPLVSKEDFERVQTLLNTHLSGTTSEKPTSSWQDNATLKRLQMISGEHIKSQSIYGYVKQSDGSWAIDPVAAKVIEEIFALALQGIMPDEIKTNLTLAEYPIPSDYIKLSRGATLTPSCQWTRRSVQDILNNIQYTGAYVSGKIVKNYETGKLYHTPQSEWIVIPDKHPAIISKEVYDNAQKIASESRRKRRNTPRDYLLRGKTKCGCCGYALFYDSSQNTHYYRCHHTTAAPDAECHKMKVGGAELDEAILTLIRKQAEVVLNANNLNNLRKKSNTEQEVTGFEEQIQKLTEQHQRLYERFILREIDRTEYLHLKENLAAELDRLSKQVSALKSEMQSRQSDPKALVLAKQAVGETIPHRELVDALIEKVRVFPDKRIEIEWKYTDFMIGL
jgi:DNA invertase Pin-like site-specific DNA recombinase